jgi:hypothetical protein
MLYRIYGQHQRKHTERQPSSSGTCGLASRVTRKR